MDSSLLIDFKQLKTITKNFKNISDKISFKIIDDQTFKRTFKAIYES